MKKWGQRLLVMAIATGFLSGTAAWSQQAPATAVRSAAAPAVNTVGKVNLNTADEAALTSLKGIGKTKAKAILDYRQKNGSFKTVDDLKNVKGIGDKTLAGLRAQLSVD